MRRATTGLLATVLLVLAGWVLAPSASACSCTGGTAADQALRADAVFAGRLVDRRVVDGTALHVFAVDTVYTGRVAARQGVLSPASGASCGLELAGDGPFLVFADHAGGRLASDLCGGTTAWTPEAAAQVQVLTGARAPAPGTAGTDLPGGLPDAAVEAAVAVLLVVAFVGGLALRRRAAG